MELPCMTQQQRDILGVIIEKGISDLEDKMAEGYFDPLYHMYEAQKRFLEEFGQAVDLTADCEIPQSDMTWELDRYGNITLKADSKSLYLQGDDATRFLVDLGLVPENVGTGDSDQVPEGSASDYYDLLV
jgi:hypothetical protein